MGVPLPFSVSSLGFTGCNLYTSIEVSPAVATGTTGINNGYAFFHIPFPLATGTPQVTLNGQWLVVGTGASAPGALSGGLSWPH